MTWPLVLETWQHAQSDLEVPPWALPAVGDRTDVSCTWCEQPGHTEPGCPSVADYERERAWLNARWYEL